MSPLEIVTIVVCVLIVAGVFGVSLYRHRKGKPSCCSECSSCRYASVCAKNHMNEAQAHTAEHVESYQEKVFGCSGNCSACKVLCNKKQDQMLQCEESPQDKD